MDNRSRIFTITLFHSVAKPQQELEIIKNLERTNQLVGALIGPTEKTKTEKSHNHILIKFVNKKTLEQVMKLFPNQHIEIVRGTLSQAYSYAIKETENDGTIIYDTLKNMLETAPKLSIDAKLGIIIDKINKGIPLIELLNDVELNSVVIRYYNQISKLYFDIYSQKLKER